MSINAKNVELKILSEEQQIKEDIKKLKAKISLNLFENSIINGYVKSFNELFYIKNVITHIVIFINLLYNNNIYQITDDDYITSKKIFIRFFPLLFNYMKFYHIIKILPYVLEDDSDELSSETDKKYALINKLWNDKSLILKYEEKMQEDEARPIKVAPTAIPKTPPVQKPRTPPKARSQLQSQRLQASSRSRSMPSQPQVSRYSVLKEAFK